MSGDAALVGGAAPAEDPADDLRGRRATAAADTRHVVAVLDVLVDRLDGLDEAHGLLLLWVPCADNLKGTGLR
jgi:hypothetical protein